MQQVRHWVPQTSYCWTAHRYAVYSAVQLQFQQQRQQQTIIHYCSPLIISIASLPDSSSSSCKLQRYIAQRHSPPIPEFCNRQLLLRYIPLYSAAVYDSADPIDRRKFCYLFSVAYYNLYAFA